MAAAHLDHNHDEDLGDLSFQRWADTYRDAIAIYQALIDVDGPGIKVIRENTSCPACLLTSVALLGLNLACGATGMGLGPAGRPVFCEHWEAELRRRLGSIRAEGPRA
jgi:hypothetical protein